jgi:predicted MFS family arabinose efflux permease
MTLSDAVRTGSFWIISFLFMATWLVVFVPIVHLAPFVTSIGGTATGASLALSAIGLGGLVGRVLSGPAADRVGELPVLIAMLVVEIACYTVFATASDLLVITIAAVGFGAAYGATVTLFSAVVGARFGRLHAGSIVGAIFIGAATSSAAGPLIAGILFDRTGGYSTTFAIGAVANVGALMLAVALLLVARPRTAGATP